MMYFLTELEGRAVKIFKRTELRSLFVVKCFSTEITNFSNNTCQSMTTTVIV